MLGNFSGRAVELTPADPSSINGDYVFQDAQAVGRGQEDHS